MKEKPNNKVKTPDGGEGEPSGDIRSEVENSATPVAVSSVRKSFSFYFLIIKLLGFSEIKHRFVDVSLIPCRHMLMKK